MAKLQVGLETLEEIARNDCRPASPVFDHLKEEPAMPAVSFVNSSVDLDGDPAKEIFDSRIEGVQERGEGRQLDGAGHLSPDLIEERLMDRQQLLELSLFDGNLILEIRPHAGGIPSSSGIR